MPTLSDVRAHQAAVADIATLGIAELLAFWRAQDLENAGATAGAVREFLPELFAGFVPLAAELGAGFYEDARADADVPGAYEVELAPVPEPARVSSLAGWGIAPLFKTQIVTMLDGRAATVAAPDPRLAFNLLSGGVQRVIADGARETVELNIQRDPAEPKYARHASSNACAFCALNASRGAVYRSERTAGGKYHDHCHCVAVPSWGGDYQPAPYVQAWDAAYRSASREVGTGTSAVLAHMRQSLGAS